MIGYKATDMNGCCRGFKFEVGKTYTKDTKKEDLKCCTDTGFHFCRELWAIEQESDYKLSESRLFEVIAGDVVCKGDKYCTNSITILREIEGEEKENLINTGDRNTGDWNAGYSQEKAADILGFAKSTIGQVEAGRQHFPSFYLFFLLCELYGVTPEDMFRGRIEPKLSVEKN